MYSALLMVFCPKDHGYFNIAQPSLLSHLYWAGNVQSGIFVLFCFTRHFIKYDWELNFYNQGHWNIKVHYLWFLHYISNSWLSYFAEVFILPKICMEKRERKFSFFCCIFKYFQYWPTCLNMLFFLYIQILFMV